MTSASSGTRHERVRCAIYTRKSSEEGLEQEFNSLQAQREACEAFINSQRHEGWVCLGAAYDDGGFSGAAMDRPALKRLLTDITAGRVDTIVVYKIDRLTRSLADFAKIVASSKCVTVDGRHGSAPGRKDTPRAARSCQQDERSPLDRYGSAWKPRRRPKCAFSDGYWRERLL
jgi:Resolvase, N terminal domain